MRGDVVFAVELVLGKDAQKDVLGEDVLDEHFTHVGFGNGRADALSALFEEFGGVLLVVRVVCLGVFHRLPQIFEDGGQVCFEQLLGMSELLDLRQFVVEEAEYETVEVGGFAHVDPHGFFTVLE